MNWNIFISAREKSLEILCPVISISNFEGCWMMTTTLHSPLVRTVAMVIPKKREAGLYDIPDLFSPHFPFFNY